MHASSHAPLNCLLVQTRFSEMSFWNYVDVCKIVGAKYPSPPLGLITVAALLPQHWNFRLVDENIQPLRDADLAWADLVCTGGMLPQQNGMLALIDRVHAHGLPIAVGGPDPTSQPDLYASADYLVLGEGEISIPLFVADLERGAMTGRYSSTEKADMTHAVVPRFDLLRLRDYLQVGIQFSRGCPYNCEFCDIIELFGRVSRTKTPEQIIRELQALYDLGYRGHVDFVDDNFIGNKRSVMDVLPVIEAWSRTRRHPFYFSTEASITLAEDSELLQLMKDVDFRYVFIGIETPSAEVLTAINKRQNLRRSIADAVHVIASYGMIVTDGFIVGFDDETPETAAEMIECIQDAGICMAMVGKLSALPNTQLTKRLRLEGRLLRDGAGITSDDIDIDQTSGGLNFVTRRPRAEVLTDYLNIIEHIYDPRRYYERAAQTGLQLRSQKKHPTTLREKGRLGLSFPRIARNQGLRRQTRRPFWRMLGTVARGNPSGLEGAVSLAAMFVHFRKQAQYVLERTRQDLVSLELNRPPLAADTGS